MNLEAEDIRRGLKNDEFIPFFQPLVILRTSQLVGFEILARWLHPAEGMVSPDAFVAVAEQNGLLPEIMRALLIKSFAAEQGLPRVARLAINVSPLQLHDRTISEQIQRTAEASGFPLQQLVIEITENALIDNLDLAHSILTDLKALGCKIALDDFGTGYSSLFHLQSLPFDELKVDRSFVTSITERRESRKIVSAIVGLGHSLGLTTVAEGVETIEQAEILLRLGCEIGQGWFFGKPIPAQALHSAFLLPPRRIVPRKVMHPWGDTFGSSSLSHSLAQFEALYIGAPIGLAFLNRDLRYINVNQQLADMHGVLIHEYFGKPAAKLIPEIFPRIERYLLRALAGESISGVEIYFPEGTTRRAGAFLASYLPVHDEAHEVVGVTVAVIDITQRYLAESALFDKSSSPSTSSEAKPSGVLER